MPGKMRLTVFICIMLAVIAACGCIVNTDNGAPTLAPMRQQSPPIPGALRIA